MGGLHSRPDEDAPTSPGKSRLCGGIFSRTNNKPLSERADDIRTLCIQRIPAWKDIPYHQIAVHPIKAALSNTIIFVKLISSSDDNKDSSSTSTIEPNRAIIRFYGRASSQFFDATHERIIARLLPKLGLGAPILSEFSSEESNGLGEGRIEGYLTGRNLLHTEMSIPFIAKETSAFMARLHCITPTPSTLALGDATSSASSPSSSLIVASLSQLPQHAILDRNLESWYKLCGSVSFPTDASTIPAVLRDTVTPKQWSASQERKQLMLNDIGIGSDGSLETEIKWLKQKLVAIRSPVVFCHNDAQAGNLLYYDPKEPQYEPGSSYDPASPSSASSSPTNTAPNDTDNTTTDSADNKRGEEVKRASSPSSSTPPSTASASNRAVTTGVPSEGWQLRAIDFEYAAYNYRGFDLGNYMCEHVFNNNYELYPYYAVDNGNFPSSEFMRSFCRDYLYQVKQLSKASSTSPTTPSVIKKNISALNDNNDNDNNDITEIRLSDINALVLETEYGMLASNLQWCLWGIVQAYNQPSSTFGYMEYARDRYREYIRHKRVLLDRDSASLPL